MSLGIASGLVTFLLVGGMTPDALLSRSGLYRELLASATFAAFALAYFFLGYKTKIGFWKATAWVAASSLSFRLALLAIAWLLGLLPDTDLALAVVLFGGGVGGLTIATAFHFLIARMKKRQWALLLCTTILASSAFFTPQELGGVFVLYSVWQTATLLALGHVLAAARQAKSP